MALHTLLRMPVRSAAIQRTLSIYTWTSQRLCCLPLWAQIYSQIYLNGDPYKVGLANTPFATNYTSPILHNAILTA